MDQYLHKLIINIIVCLFVDDAIVSFHIILRVAFNRLFWLSRHVTLRTAEIMPQICHVFFNNEVRSLVSRISLIKVGMFFITLSIACGSVAANK